MAFLHLLAIPYIFFVDFDAVDVVILLRSLLFANRCCNTIPSSDIVYGDDDDDVEAGDSSFSFFYICPVAAGTRVVLV